MKKTLAMLALASVALLSAHSALAQGATYVFPYEGFRYTQGDHETVLTQTNLDQNAALIDSLGTTKDAILASYLASGIVMEVIPDDGGQIAVSVADAGAFSDVSRMGELSAARLAEFAAQFEDSGLYETCELTDTVPVCVRLTSSAMYGSMPVYTLRYATLHLGQLYLLTQTVVGRAPQAQDDAQLTQVLQNIEFLSALAAPTAVPTPAPTLAPTATPIPSGEAEAIAASGELTVTGVPAYTTEANLSLSGKAARSTTVEVIAGGKMLGSTMSASDGSFALDVTLPQTGELLLTVAAGDAERSFSVIYALPAAQLTITEPEDTTFTGNYVFVRGVTEPNATVYITGKGTNTNVQANRTGNFSIRLFMYDEGTETFTFRVRPRGLSETTAEVTLTRVLTEREALAQFRQEMNSLRYADLAADPSAYRGRKFSFRGRIVEFADYDGTPCALVLTNNVSTGVWRDPLWVILPGGEEFAVDDVVTFYLEGEGTTLRADGQYTASGNPVDAPIARAVFTSTNR